MTPTFVSGLTVGIAIGFLITATCCVVGLIAAAACVAPWRKCL